MSAEHSFEPPALSSDEMLERMQMLRYKVHEKKIEEIWADLTSAGFEPLLIKGWAAAQFYPKPYKREFSDIDLVINPAEYDDVKNFLKENPKGYNIDLHRGVRRHDTLPFAEIAAAAESLKCGAAEVRVPRPEDHLRILCVHWLTDGGAYRERLWDIYYAIANRTENFDWARLLDVVSPNRRRWIVCTIGLAHKYLDLPIDDTPIATEARKLPNWLIKTVESEWASDIRLQPLAGIQYKSGNNSFLSQIKSFMQANFAAHSKESWAQMRKRLIPNPVYATVDLEGNFDGKMMAYYQLRNFIRRLKKFGLIKDE